MVPIIGSTHRLSSKKQVVGISKLARVLEAYAKRMQMQEKLTAWVANSRRRS